MPGRTAGFPTSAGRETKLSKELQQGFCRLVLWLEEQEGCQALPQCRLQLCFLGLPRKCFVCIGDRDSSESPWFIAHWGAAQGKTPLAGVADSPPRYPAVIHQCCSIGISWWPVPLW